MRPQNQHVTPSSEYTKAIRSTQKRLTSSRELDPLKRFQFEFFRLMNRGYLRDTAWAIVEAAEGLS